MRKRPSMKAFLVLAALAVPAGSDLSCQVRPTPPGRNRPPWEAGKNDGGKKEGERKPAFPPTAERKEAKALLKAFQKNLSRGKKFPVLRREAIQSLVQKAHPSFVKPLVKLATRDKSKLVRAAALEALGRLNFPETRKALVKILSRRGLVKDPLAFLAALDAVNRLGYHPAFFRPLASLFQQAWDLKTPGVPQQKILRLFRKGKEKRAFRLLVDNLDEPRPADVDSPSNPPASWWEKRWKAWHFWKKDVKAALKEITGVEFDRADFYRKWARRKGRKKGIKY